MAPSDPAGPRVGVDLGGTKILAVRVEDGAVVAEEKRSTPRDGPAAVLEAVAAMVRRLGTDVVAVGLGGPGRVDHRRGILGPAPNIPGWDVAVPVADHLTADLGLPVRVDNDVNAAALAEHRWGAGAGHADLLVVFVGTGVGGALVLGDHLVRGRHGLAGEIGHMMVVPDGRRCGCGRAGHVEAYAGRRGVERAARERHAAGEPTLLVERQREGRITSTVVVEALAAGDRVARELVDAAALALGRGIAAAVALVDVSQVVLGGGFAERLGPGFAAAVADQARTLGFPGTELTVVRAALGDRAGARGAALLGVTPPR